MKSFKSFFAEQNLTLQYHDKLNPVLWNNDKLLDNVRKHLLKIAEEWRKFSNIPEKAIKDIVFTGGNANYNYTKFSDIDIHILIDKKKVTKCDPEFMTDYYKDKKSLWKQNHDINVLGYPVELYAQDTNDPTSSNQGVYSLKQNKWLSKPKKEKIDLKDYYLLKKIEHLKHHINSFIDSKSDDVKQMEEFKNKLRDVRNISIQRGGEFSLENLAFKELRNRGYLEKLSNYIKKIQDKNLSLDWTF